MEEDSPLLFSDWLKRRRRALDMTQDELAQRAGCSVGALRKIESGERRPSKQLAALLAQALEIPQEDQATFRRVARGELTLERLRVPGQERSHSLPELAQLEQKQRPGATREASKPPSSRLPLQAAPLIGREFEFEALERIFHERACRLLTLTGIGGIGKTRLAVDFATRKRQEFPGGVFYIPLAPVEAPDKIVPAIADVFDFRFSGPSEPKEQLFRYFASHIQQKALFILDNLEHLLCDTSGDGGLSGVVELVAEMLQRLPEVTILATSRERLNMHGEWTYELHGLSIPPTHFSGALESYKAAALFIQSAQRARVDFHLSTEEEPFLVKICQIVEGVPLAIELAAAWVGLLSCKEIAQEIQSNLDFLATSMRDIPERHRSIRATFDHSWKLLSGEEREILCQLSVFQGGFDREAAQQVAGASLVQLASLNAKSLVRRNESGHYDLHEVIRQYASGHLQDNSKSLETYTQHCAYYLRILSESEHHLKTGAQQETVRRLSGDIDNLRAAWTWAIQHKRFDLLGLAGRAYGWYFEITGLYRDGIEQLEDLVQGLKFELQDEPWQRLCGLAYLHQALLHFRQGEFAPAMNLYQESSGHLRRTRDRVLLADALIFSGTILHLNGYFDQARLNLEEGLFLARSCNDTWLAAFATFNLGFINSMTGYPMEGYQQMQTSVNQFRALGDPQVTALGLNFQVPSLIRLGRYAEAKASMQESIALCKQSQNRWGMGTAYSYYGLACIAAGEYDQAKDHLYKSLEIFSEYITGWNIARSLTYLGDAFRLNGELGQAKRYYQEGVRSAVEGKSLPILMDALAGMSYILEQAGNLQTALLLGCYIVSHAACEEETRMRIDQFCLDLEKKMDHKKILAAHTQAENTSLEEIISAALEETSSTY